jgi:hypothetical protein
MQKCLNGLLKPVLKLACSFPYITKTEEENNGGSKKG